MLPGRNEPCSCGSGRKYKHCCGKQAVAPAPDSMQIERLIALFHAGRYAEMEHGARTLVDRHPRSGFAWKLYGTALGVQGKDALSALQQAATLLPDDLEAHANLGNCLQDTGQADRAVASYRHALAINPNIPELHNNLGNALKNLGQNDAALESYRRALALNPHYAEAYGNLGVALLELRQIDDAIGAFCKALEISPNLTEAHCNLGNAYRELGQRDKASDSYRRALVLDPGHADAHNGLGSVLHEIGRFDEALSSFRRALATKPDHADAHSNLAHLLLALGDGQHGFEEYEWRYSRDAAGIHFPPAHVLLPFNGQGKRVLLCYEQGIGDEIFFLRFASALRAQAKWVGYLSTPKVHTLIARSGCVDQVVARIEDASDMDLMIPVGDLPLLMGCVTPALAPAPLRLSPMAQHRAHVRQHLTGLGLMGQRLLGVTWRGGVAAAPGQRKSLFKAIDLDLLANAIRDWPGAILILQRHPDPKEIDRLRTGVPCPVHDLSAYNDDLESMLALLDELDDYVGVSNTNMHLMAGLGKTARVLAPEPAEWRWMEGVKESPWFLGFAIYRQRITGDWGPATAELARDLADHP